MAAQRLSGQKRILFSGFVLHVIQLKDVSNSNQAASGTLVEQNNHPDDQNDNQIR